MPPREARDLLVYPTGHTLAHIHARLSHRKPRQEAQIDYSPQAEIERIEKTFASCNVPLDQLRHPTKPHLQAVEAFDVLPDPETWATDFQIFRFSDFPGRTRVCARGGQQTQSLHRTPYVQRTLSDTDILFIP